MIQSGFPRLMSPGRIAGITIKNRIVMPAMGMNMSDGGYVNQAVINHYTERAKGGAGLIVVEVTCVDAPLGLNTRNMLAIDDDAYIPGFARLTRNIHAHGAKCVLQISHTGRGAKRKNTGGQPVGPSAVRMPFSMVTGLEGEEPRALTEVEILAIEDKYAAAALRAKEAGFDGVQVHATGYYLVSQFLSASANRRTDAYGGNARRRATFALNILRKIKTSAGTDFPVIYKLSLLELGKQGGIGLFDGLLYAYLLQEAGADAIEVLAMSYKDKPTLRDVPDSAQGTGLTFPLARLLKLSRVFGRSTRPNLFIGRKAMRIPLISGGRAFDPVLAEKALRAGLTDFVFMGRGLLAEPGLPHMIKDGTYGLARPCIGCGRCIDNQLQHQSRAVCSGNAVVGKDDNDYTIPPAEISRKVLVIGGGPGGMEAARIAGYRGHTVLLAEKDMRLGGQLHYAVAPPHKHNLKPLIAYYERQLAKAGVKVVLRRNMQAQEIIAGGYDAVICATGVAPAALPIPGFDQDHVISAKAVLSGKTTGRTVVIIGGGLVGCETAEFLLKRKRSVAIVEMLPELASKMPVASRIILLGHLKKLGAHLYTGHICREITAKTVAIEDNRGVARILKADTVVIAVGDKPDTALYDALRDNVAELYLIGDASCPEGIAESVAAGYYTGLRI